MLAADGTISVAGEHFLDGCDGGQQNGCVRQPISEALVCAIALHHELDSVANFIGRLAAEECEQKEGAKSRAAKPQPAPDWRLARHLGQG